MLPALPLALLAPLLSSPALAPQSAAVAPSAPRNVAILVFDGVELLDFAGPGEVFAAARGSSGRAFRVYTVGKAKRTVRSQGFVDVTPEFSIEDCPAPAIVVLPGGNVPDEDRELQDWVRRCSGSAELVMSVCNGALLLGRTGMLDGLEATTHHSALGQLAIVAPKASVLTNRRFLDHGQVMTCAGVSAGIDGALHVVARLLGDDSAQRTARYMEYDWRPDEIAKRHAEPPQRVGEGPEYALADLALASGVAAALEKWRASTPRPDERTLNVAGYSLLSRQKRAEARALFELAVAAFPDSANALDSLSEACEGLGDTAAAVRHAKAAIAKATASPTAENAAAIRDASAARIARIEKTAAPGATAYACPPCGGSCDSQRHPAPGACPGCGMAMAQVAQ